jgi:hypothetical protein
MTKIILTFKMTTTFAGANPPKKLGHNIKQKIKIPVWTPGFFYIIKFSLNLLNEIYFVLKKVSRRFHRKAQMKTKCFSEICNN